MMRSLRVAPSTQRQFGQSQALASHVKLQGQMAGAAGHPLDPVQRDDRQRIGRSQRPGA